MSVKIIKDYYIKRKTSLESKLTATFITKEDDSLIKFL